MKAHQNYSDLLFCVSTISGPLNNRLTTICEENEDTHSLPPPYTTARDRYSEQKIQFAVPPLSPNEPPPPYEMDTREATQV